MKKLFYSIVIVLFSFAGQAQNLVFSWYGTFFDLTNDSDSVYLFVQNTGLQDVYLIGFGPSRLYFQNSNILIAGEPGGTNPNYTHSSTAVANGFVGTAANAADALTMQGVAYDRFVGVAPSITADGFGGLLLDGEGMVAEGDESSSSLPVKMGTYRLRVEANSGGTGCFVTAPFQAFATYTSSLTPRWDPDLEVVVPLTGPCAAGCAIVLAGQAPIPEQGNACCASCALLGGAPLPVLLVKFAATKFQETHSSLFWQTANEENVNHFEIQRSKDRSTWELVGKASAHGNSNSVKSYSMVDMNVYDGRSPRALYYYRLKIVDNDGAFQYSEIETVRFNSASGVFGAYIYPNPSSDELTVELNYAEDSAPVRDLLIYNNLGQLVYSQEVADGQDVVYLNHATTGLVAGSYTLELRDVNNNPVSQDKIVVQR